MKRGAFTLILVVLAVGTVWSRPLRFNDPEAVMQAWEQALRARNLDLFANCYWEDAAQWRLMPDGYMEQNEGIGVIIERQAPIFEQFGEYLKGFRLPEPQVHGPSYTGLPMFIYENPDIGTIEAFWFGERAGKIRIERQLMVPMFFDQVEAGPMQAWADENRSGILERHEQQLLFEAFWAVTNEPHPVANPMDEFFDWNENGRIEEEETLLAQAALIRDSLRRSYRFFPAFAEHYLDQNRSGTIDAGEANMARDLAYGEAGERPVESPLHESIDFIPDGMISQFERQIFQRIVTLLLATVPEWPVLERSADSIEPVVAWADANGDGIIGEEELHDIGNAIRWIARGMEQVISPVQILYDTNRDLKLSRSESERAVRELIFEQLPEAFQTDLFSVERKAVVGELDLNEDGWLDDREIDIFLELTRLPEELVDRRAVKPLEKRIDREPRNGVMDEWEVWSFSDGVYASAAEVWLLGSGQVVWTPMGLAAGELRGEAAVYRPTVEEGGEEEVATAPDDAAAAREAAAGASAAAATASMEAASKVTGTLSAEVTLNPVYPVLFKYYDKAPVGEVVIENGTSVEAKNVQVKLDMKRYIDSPRVSDTIASLAPGEVATVDLLALFNEDVLDLTEGTRTMAEVTIAYENVEGGQQLAVSESMIFYDRNAIRWDHDEKVASFVTAKDPQIRLLATNMAALIRKSRNESISENLQNAMVLYAAMAEHNLGYNVDPSSSYKQLSKDALTVDYVQFPRQTLMFKGGDCDDLSVCYAALLEAIGIPSAFITVPGHIYVAFALKMDASTAKARFSDPDDLIFAADGTVWVPVEITKLGDRSPEFLDAWEQGAKEWREHSGRGQAELIPTGAAWKTYEPVAASFMTETVALPDTENVLETFQKDLARFVSLEIADQELTLQGKLASEPDSPKLLNLLGTLYARYGLTAKAKEKFQAAVAEQDYYAALMNLGHLEFLDEEYVAASGYYQRALSAQPESARAILALARTDHELENYGNVKRYYAKLEELDQELAEEYGYLDLRASESVRAQESSRLRSFVIWEAEE